MFNIYIDCNKREITIKDKKDRMINKYTNLSTKNRSGLNKAIKLFMISLNKIFLANRFNDEEYVFYINDNIFVNIIKLENNSFREHIDPEWHTIYSHNTTSQLGNLLKSLKKIESKNVCYWERDELFELKDKREVLYMEQAENDIKTQDILHYIQVLKEDEITDINCIAIIYKLREIRKIRNKIKENIKEIDKKERLINYER